MLFGFRMACANPNTGEGGEAYRPIKCIQFIQEKDGFKRNMKEQIARFGFDYYNVS